MCFLHYLYFCTDPLYIDGGRDGRTDRYIIIYIKVLYWRHFVDQNKLLNLASYVVVYSVLNWTIITHVLTETKRIIKNLTRSYRSVCLQNMNEATKSIDCFPLDESCIPITGFRPVVSGQHLFIQSTWLLLSIMLHLVAYIWRIILRAYDMN